MISRSHHLFISVTVRVQVKPLDAYGAAISGAQTVGSRHRRRLS